MVPNPNTIQRIHGYRQDAFVYYPILIIGAGESGIALGCRIKQVLGFDQFRIFERQSGAGGTWWSNRYPGVACDIPAIFYSFSFAPNYKWSSFHPSGDEILHYMYEVCGRYQIVDKIQCNTDVSDLRWLEDEQLWEATLLHMVPGTGDLSRREREQLIAAEGRERVYFAEEKVRARVVCTCAGGFVEPNPWPSSIPGHDRFEGPIIHSARWKQDVSLEDKDVVLIGTGCSAAQIIPKLTKAPYKAKSVTQVMRSAPWVVPGVQPPMGPEKWQRWGPTLLTYVPALHRLLRAIMFGGGEFHWFTLFQTNSFATKMRLLHEASMRQRMKREAPEKYHRILQPDYAIGCKRRIFGSYWFSSLHDPKVELTSRPVVSVNTKTITLGPEPDHEKSSNGSAETDQIPADVIVLANGFEVTNWLLPMTVTGKRGADLHATWEERGGPQAYMGTAMDGFPNFFIVFGPNTATGHSSVIFATECMVEHTIRFLGKILNGDVSIIEVKKEAEVAWTERIQRELKNTIFTKGGCTSWYKDEKGWNATAYSRSQIDFWIRCMFPRWSDWDIEYTRKGMIKVQLKRTLLMALFAMVACGAFLARRAF